MPDQNTEKAKTLIHDINSSISALQGAFEVIRDEWQSNPELVERFIPLSMEKLQQLDRQLSEYRHNS